MIIKKAVYRISVANKKDILNDNVPEFAFVGRSNVGKSSIINMLTNNKGLAKASSTPGKTRLVNYFDINDNFRFVDLPGYGYAKVGKGHLDVWSGLIGEYLQDSESLLTVFVLLDIRHLPTVLDKQMIEYLVYNNLPFKILATKCDKIAKSKVNSYIAQIAKELNLREEIFIRTSSVTGEGKDKILSYIDNLLGN